jgi:rubrerythrin
MSDKLVKFLENQITLENKIVKSITESAENIDNEAVSTALQGISLDSKKHAMMYQSAISLMTSTSAALNDEQLDLQKKVVDDHIKMEEAVIKELDKMLPSVENEKVEILLKAILQDEKRHHKLLKTLYEILIRGEAVTEGDWWDAVWGDVPGLWG